MDGNMRLMSPWMVLALIAVVGVALGLGLTVVLGSEPTSSGASAEIATAADAPTATADIRATKQQENVATPAQASAAADLLPTTPDPGKRESPMRGPEVEPDPDFGLGLMIAGISTRGWATDFSRHTVPYSEIMSGGVPRDGIPPVDDPRFTTPENAGEWVADNEPVIAFELNGDARAYPLQVMTWHEIVNDVVGGVPVAVTFCPLCNSAIVFDRRLGGVTYDFGTSGMLRRSDLIMWDRQTESWWQQFTGEGIVGELAGSSLKFLPATIHSFADFASANPEGKVLSRDTGFSRDYGRNPYAGYDRADNSPFLFRGDLDGRLLPMERVVTVTIDDADVAFPFSFLEQERVVSYTVNGQDMVVFFKAGTASALDQGSISGSRDVGAAGVFDSRVEGRRLTFRADGDAFVDQQTGSVWNVLGRALDGPLTGAALTPLVHGDHFWFAWAAFKPDTAIYGGTS